MGTSSKITSMLAGALVLMATACTTPTSTSSSPASPSGTSVLAAYGVNANLGAAATSGNPFGSAVAVPVPRKQIYLGGLTNGGYHSSLLKLDTTNTTFTTPFTQPDSVVAWSKMPHASTAAFLPTSTTNAKIVQKVVTVVFTLTTNSGNWINGGDNQGTVSFKVWNGSTETDFTPFGTTVFHAYNGDYEYGKYSQVSIGAGDMNGDGVDEIAVTIGNTLAVVDSSFSTYKTVDLSVVATGSTNTSTTDFHPSALAVGDVNGDSKAEIVATYGNHSAGTKAQLFVYTWDGSSSLGTPLQKSLLRDDGEYLEYANVALGDVNGDGTKDIVVVGDNNNGYTLLGLTLDSNSQLIFLSGLRYHQDLTSSNWTAHPMIALACFNPFAKGTTTTPDYIYVFGHIEKYTGSETTWVTDIGGPNYAYVTAGDVNYDGKDELILWANNSIEVWGILKDATTVTKLNSSAVTTDSGYYYSLCAADLVGDSLVVQYTGTALHFANPSVVAVLASPPYYAGTTSAALGNVATSLGTSHTTGQSATASLEVRASFTIGEEVSAPIENDALSESEKLTIGASFSTSFTSAKSTTTSVQYSTMAGKTPSSTAAFPMTCILTRY